MNNQIVVYLDSQDFSRLSPSHRDYPTLKPIRETLLAFKNDGVAKFVFSDIHIFEAMPTQPDLRIYGLERIRTIAEFCGTDNLPSSITLIDHELDKTCGIPTDLNLAEWYPHFDLEAPNREKIFGEAVNDVASNRKQRRMLAKMLKRSIPTTYSNQFAEELVAKYPFLQGEERILRSYASGHASWDKVVNSIKSGLKDIVGFSEWLVANWDQGQSFVESLRAGNRKVQTSLVELHERMKNNFNNSLLPEDVARRIISSIYEEQRERFFLTFVQRNRTEIVHFLPAAGTLPAVDPTQAPSLTAAFSFLAEVAYLSALPKAPRNPNKHAGSDFADAMHVLFLPHVDIFRADQFSCSVLRKMPALRTDGLCNSLQELPRMISEFSSVSR